MKLSIVATLYHSSEYVDEFCRRASAVARNLVGEDFEIVLVNDGSPDDSLDRAVRVSAADPHVIVVDLSRNFGHHKAMMTGLAHSLGQRVFLIDSDLEEEPEWLDRFWAELDRAPGDVVYGVQMKRKGGFVERWTGRAFYRLLPALTGIDMPRNMVTARLMTRRYVDALLQHQDRESDIGGLWTLTGFVQRGLLVAKHGLSATTYTLSRRIVLTVNSITSFSALPLRAMLYFGVLLFVVACASATWVFGRWLFGSRPVDASTVLLLSVWMLGAMIISCLGIIGLYLGKMFSEVKRRPYTIVREIHGRQPR